MTGQETWSFYKANVRSDACRTSYICNGILKPTLDKWNFICIVVELQGRGCWDLQLLEASKIKLSLPGSWIFFSTLLEMPNKEKFLYV